MLNAPNAANMSKHSAKPGNKLVAKDLVRKQDQAAEKVEQEIAALKNPAIVSAKQKLEMMADAQIKPADMRKCVSLASTDEAKKIVEWTNSTKNELVLTQSSGKKMVMKKAALPLQTSPWASAVIMKWPEDEGARDMLAVIDKNTGLTLPFVGVSMALDVPSLYGVGGTPLVEQEKRLMLCNSLTDQLATQTYAFAQAELVAAGVRELNIKKHQVVDYWDTYVVGESPMRESAQAVYAWGQGQLLMQNLNRVFGALETVCSSSIKQFWEINPKLGCALSSGRAIPHHKVTKDEPICISMNQVPRNLPSTLLSVLIRNYAMTNGGLYFVPNPFVYMPPSRSIVNDFHKAWDLEYVFDLTNQVLPLGRLQVVGRMPGTEYEYTLCTGVNEKRQVVVFGCLTFHPLVSAFTECVDNIAAGLGEQFIKDTRQIVMNVLHSTLYTGRVTTNQPIVLDGEMRTPFITATRAPIPSLPVETEEEEKTMAAEQQAIADSWEETLPMKSLVQRVLPSGVFVGENDGDGPVDGMVYKQHPTIAAHVNGIKFLDSNRLAEDELLNKHFGLDECDSREVEDLVNFTNGVAAAVEL